MLLYLSFCLLLNYTFNSVTTSNVAGSAITLSFTDCSWDGALFLRDSRWRTEIGILCHADLPAFPGLILLQGFPCRKACAWIEEISESAALTVLFCFQSLFFL